MYRVYRCLFYIKAEEKQYEISMAEDDVFSNSYIAVSKDWHV